MGTLTIGYKLPSGAITLALPPRAKAVSTARFPAKEESQGQGEGPSACGDGDGPGFANGEKNGDGQECAEINERCGSRGEMVRGELLQEARDTPEDDRWQCEQDGRGNETVFTLDVEQPNGGEGKRETDLLHAIQSFPKQQGRGDDGDDRVERRVSGTTAAAFAPRDNAA